MTTGYVVTEIGYEYNDEIYHQSEHGGGTPVRIYLDKEKAQAEVNRLNMEAFVTCEIGQYAYDVSELVSDMEEFEKIIKKYDKEGAVDLEDGYEMGEWFSENASKFSKSDQKKLLDLVQLEFYTLTEVEIDDSKLPPKKEKENKKFSNLE